jgi:hypothetical protein
MVYRGVDVHGYVSLYEVGYIKIVGQKLIYVFNLYSCYQGKMSYLKIKH